MMNDPNGNNQEIHNKAPDLSRYQKHCSAKFKLDFATFNMKLHNYAFTPKLITFRPSICMYPSPISNSYMLSLLPPWVVVPIYIYRMIYVAIMRILGLDK